MYKQIEMVAVVISLIVLYLPVNAEVRIVDVAVTAEAPHCVVLNVETDYSGDYLEKLPLLRAYALTDNSRNESVTYRPQSYVLPGQSSATTLIKLMHKYSGSENSGLHIGAYSHVEKLLDMQRMPFPKDWEHSEGSRAESGESRIIEVRKSYQSDRVLVLDVHYEYGGSEICYTALSATAKGVKVREAKIGSRPQTVIPGKNWGRVELTVLESHKPLEVSEINIQMYEYMPQYKYIADFSFKMEKRWVVDPEVERSDRHFCSSWQKE